MGHPGAGLGQQGGLARIDVDRVGDDRARPEDVVGVQAVDDAHAGFRQAVVLVDFVLGDVDVKPTAGWRSLAAGIQGIR